LIGQVLSINSRDNERVALKSPINHEDHEEHEEIKQGISVLWRRAAQEADKGVFLPASLRALRG
jgi:hypothetical protein